MIKDEIEALKTLLEHDFDITVLKSEVIEEKVEDWSMGGIGGSSNYISYTYQYYIKTDFINNYNEVNDSLTTRFDGSLLSNYIEKIQPKVQRILIYHKLIKDVVNDKKAKSHKV